MLMILKAYHQRLVVEYLSYCFMAYSGSHIEQTHMDEWPKNPYICYYDGYLVPVLIGAGEKLFRGELRTPIYELTDTELSLRI